MPVESATAVTDFTDYTAYDDHNNNGEGLLLKSVVLTVRVTEEMREQLDELAKLARQQTGENWSIADIVRQAVQEKIKRESK